MLVATGLVNWLQHHLCSTSLTTWELSGLALPIWWRLELPYCASSVKSMIDIHVLYSLCHHTDMTTPRAPPPARRKRQCIFSLLDACEQMKIRNLFHFQSLLQHIHQIKGTKNCIACVNSRAQCVGIHYKRLLDFIIISSSVSRPHFHTDSGTKPCLVLQ